MHMVCLDDCMLLTLFPCYDVQALGQHTMGAQMLNLERKHALQGGPVSLLTCGGGQPSSSSTVKAPIACKTLSSCHANE